MLTATCMVLYHCNDEKRCVKFLEDKNYLITSEEDGYWLGTGMYFWDNESNARYWKKKKSRNNSLAYIIIKAKVSLDNMLDLTDLDISNTIASVWNAYVEMARLPKDDLPLGMKLNLLFDHLEMMKTYDIIKVFGKYPNTPSNDLYSYNTDGGNIKPALETKCIYNVKDSKCILVKNY